MPTKPQVSAPASRGACKIFKACQTNSFSKESKEGYLFAPDDKRGEHQNLKKVQKGAIILHIFGNKMYAIGIATSDCYFSLDAHGKGEAGNYVDVSYDVFPRPVDLSLFKLKKNYPIGRNQRYIMEFDNQHFTELFIEEANRSYPSDPVPSMIKALL